jgi:hypothetical protein
MKSYRKGYDQAKPLFPWTLEYDQVGNDYKAIIGALKKAGPAKYPLHPMSQPAVVPRYPHRICLPCQRSIFFKGCSKTVPSIGRYQAVAYS